MCVETQQRTLTGPDHLNVGADSTAPPENTTASQDTEPQTNGRSGVDPVSAPRTSRVSSHMRVISHRRKAGHPFHTHDASASRDGPQAHADLPQAYQQHDRYQNERKCYDWRATAIARYSIPARRAANATVLSTMV